MPARECARIRHAAHFAQVGGEQLVGAVLNPPGGAGVGRTAIGRIVLEATIVRRIVRRRDHDAVGEPCGAAAVVSQNRVRERGSRRVAERVIDHHLDAVRRKHFERADEGGFGERVRVLGQE